MSPSTAGLPEEAHAVALASVPGIGPARLAALLRELSPSAARAAVVAGRGSPDPRLADLWAQAAAHVDVVEVWDRHVRAGVRVDVRGTAAYPVRLARDPDPPAVLFTRGSPVASEHPAVGIVGTRRCTPAGRRLAAELGHDLSRAGVSVVSGLALGIDGAAHEGALRAGGAPPIGVVGSGLDVVYPKRHAELWHGVAAAGSLLSEAPLGARPEPWRFPARNRIIAGLSDLVVVVESHAAGGSMLTVEAAARRGIDVLAVPGPVRSPASAGTNQLLYDGCAPARDADDVLVALSLDSRSAGGRSGDPVDRRPPPTDAGAAVLQALGWEPASVDELLSRTGLTPLRLSSALTRLADDGWARSDGGWWERLA